MGENKLNLNDQVSQNTLAIIWLTTTEISNSLKYYQPINYLLNGVLVNNISNSSKSRSSFFMSEGFGKPFFMGHIQIDENNLDKDIQAIVNLLIPHSDKKSEIIILDESQKLSNKLFNSINAKYADLNFRHLWP